MSKEARIKAITKLYYSQPKIQQALLEFSQNREVVPRYYEGFGKRPDVLHYPQDISNAANKGATSFHASEEHWSDPLQLNSDMTPKEQDTLRSGWDLLIDIDSPFLDCSKIATKLLIAAVEQHGIKNYGIKFSGSKGFHLIIPWAAFPENVEHFQTRFQFPAWPRAICSYLMSYIRRDYNRLASDLFTNTTVLKERTNLDEEDLNEVICTLSQRSATKGTKVHLLCPECGFEIERRDMKITKKKLTCPQQECPGLLDIIKKEDYWFDEHTKDPENPQRPLSSDRHPEYFEKVQGVSAEKVANLDLVLVAPRHLFRMPYSLHEKTALASVVLTKDQLDTFDPKDADPLTAQIKSFLPQANPGEAQQLLMASLDWARTQRSIDEQIEEKRYKENKNFAPLDLKGVPDEFFPEPIKLLLKGLQDGRKRGLFILITFFRSLGFPPEEIQQRIKKWNEKNDPLLKEGYIRSQLDWHFRQKKQILPPNYANQSYYKDLGLLKKKPETKNPVGDVVRKVHRRRPSE